jgi:hypothetical protein
MKWTNTRTNPVHYLIRFTVFIIACTLIVALIIAVCNARRDSSESGARARVHSLIYENTCPFDVHKALQPLPN